MAARHSPPRRMFRAVVACLLLANIAAAQDLDTFRNDQIDRLKNYIASAILPSGLVRDSLVLNGTSFHPATPDAAGFALLGLSALDHLDKLPDAEQRVEQILTAHTGHKAGVTPGRSADGHFIHFMNITTGAPAGGGWDASYTPIGTALLVAGAQFARNHFPDNANIAALTEQLTDSVNFNNAIHPNLSGRIFLDMGKAGGGTGGTVANWNEFMLVESLALREEDNARALAVKHRWLDTDFIPKRSFGGIPTLTDNAAVYAPAFWVQQMHFFNGDFRHSEVFEQFFDNHQQVDRNFSTLPVLSGGLGQEYRYGITAGVSPQGYNADSISNHPNNVFSPEAVAAWGDMETLLQFYEDQVAPANDPRYKYGLTRVSASQPAWIPNDAGLVDHMFLLFGLVESLDPDFFANRVFAPIAEGDFNADGTVDLADYQLWKTNYGSTSHLAADGNMNSRVDAADYVIWRNNYDGTVAGQFAGVPEPGLVSLLVPCALAWLARGQTSRKRNLRPRRCGKWNVRCSQIGHSNAKYRKHYESACNPCFPVIRCGK